MTAFAQRHAKLKSHEAAGTRYRISGTLVLDQPLHVGSGHGGDVVGTSTDSAVIKDHDDRPVIPGSSLRGALRSRCERLADALLPEDNKVCFLDPANAKIIDCVSVSEPDPLRDRNTGDLLEDKELWEQLRHHLCPSCRLFGASAYWASKVRIPDLRMVDPQEPGDAAQIRHGVGIHRDTQTAAPAIKYDQEVVTANARFGLEIIVENPDGDDLSLLALGLADLVHGRMTLGGNTSRGLGGCRVVEGKVQSVDLSQPAELVNYLTTGEYPAANQEDLTDWLENYLDRWIEED